MSDYVLKVRLDGGRKERLDSLCSRTGMTMSEVVKTLLDAIDNCRIDICGREVIATEELLDIMRPMGGAIEYEELKFGGVLRAMRKNGYPDEIIRQKNEQDIITIGDIGRYNPRRFRDEPC